MAGIGFRLQELLKKGRFSDRARAYIFSAVIATGPWLMSIMALAMISVLAPPNDVDTHLTNFRVVITWCYAFSLIYAGLWQMVITRLMADRLYVGDVEAMVPGFFTSGLLVALGAVVLGGVLFLPMNQPFPVCCMAVSLFTFICLIWHVMIFLSASNDYISSVKAFAVGALIGVIASWQLGLKFGLFGYITGFAGGQALIWALLASRLIVEFPSKRIVSTDVFFAFRKYPILILVGFFYNAGLWIDKIVYWFSDEGVIYMNQLHAFPPYDRAIFIAYLTIVPTFTVFLITVETNFARSFHDFFAAILTQRNLPEIQVAHRNMGEILDSGLMRILKIQGLVSLVAMMFSHKLGSLVDLSPASLAILRIAILAAFLHALFLSLLLLVLYFDLQKLATGLCIMFFTLNLTFTLATLDLEPIWRGYGYAAAGLASCIVGYLLLARRYHDMIFRTFTQSEIPEPAVEDL